MGLAFGVEISELGRSEASSVYTCVFIYVHCFLHF